MPPFAIPTTVSKIPKPQLIPMCWPLGRYLSMPLPNELLPPPLPFCFAAPPPPQINKYGVHPRQATQDPANRGCDSAHASPAVLRIADPGISGYVDGAPGPPGQGERGGELDLGHGCMVRLSIGEYLAVENCNVAWSEASASPSHPRPLPSQS